MARKKAADTATKKKTKAVDMKPSAFTREELKKATIFAGNRDILNALVQDGEKLTIDEAKKRIEKFLKGKVN